MGRDSAASMTSRDNLGDGQPTPKGGRSLRVFVLNQRTQPLMPCSPRRARVLVKQGRAKVVKRTPFTIQLVTATGEATQLINLGVDAGYKTIGLSATTEKKALFEAEVQLRTDVVELLSTRREFRRARRNRKTRYRKARFLNRKKPNGWLAPSVQNRIEAHLKAVKRVNEILPISKTVVEVAQFDIQKIKNPKISGAEYQQGDQLGFWNVREYVLWRDNHTCQCCHGKSKDKRLNVHHIESRKTGGDSPENLITLCETCHKRLHKNEVKLKIRRGKPFKVETFMGIMRWAFYNRLKSLYPDVSLTYGYITKNTRIANGLEKSHLVDARCISGNPSAKPGEATYFIKHIRGQNRQLHKATIRKGSHRQANKAPRYIHGFQLFDKVSFQGKECFIFGRRSSGYFDLRKLDGTRVHNSANVKSLSLLEKSNPFLIERRTRRIPPRLVEGGVSCAG